MGFITLFVVAVSLCFDTFAISLSCGMTNCAICRKQIMRLAVIFGFVQAAMAAAGWFGAIWLSDSIKNIDHWIAFGLLVIIGGKMIIDGLKNTDNVKIDISSIKIVFGMAIATSIDAVVIGVSFAFIGMPASRLLIATLMIAAVTIVAAVVGLYIGRKTGMKIGTRSEIIGGIILIIIGIKILYEHLQ